MNKCDFSKSKKEPKVKLNINKWIISELNTVSKLIEKNINDYRFDEAARNIYPVSYTHLTLPTKRIV